MLSPFDESELLALIEDELGDADAQDLRRRLAEQPEAASLIDAIKRDRNLLRTEREPEMPLDLASRIEQALTRPMLIAAWGEDEPNPQPSAEADGYTRPGEFRRRHNRPAKRRRLFRMALAAGFGLLLMGGLWAGITTALSLLPAAEHLVAQNDTQSDDPLSSAAQEHHSSRKPWPPADAVIHHYAPEPILERYHARRWVTPVLEEEPVASASPIAVDFALILAGGDPVALESSVTDIVSSSSRSSEIALVQNFSYDEAVRLERQWLARQSPARQPGQPAHASASSGSRTLSPPSRMHDLSDRALDQIRATSREEALPPSHQLAGPRELAATFAQQLAYSSRGATHTMTLRLSQLAPLLEQIESLRLADRSSLSPLPQSGSLDEREQVKGQAEVMDERGGSWVAGLAAVRKAIADLESLGGDPLIHLPIIIE